MAKVEVVKGDFRIGEWDYRNSKFICGFYKVHEIPISEIVDIIKGEVVSKNHYIEFATNTNQKFTASMNEKTYAQIYDDFVKAGNQPTTEHLPIEKTSKSNVVWAVFGVLILIGMFSGGSDDSSSNATDPVEDAKIYCAMTLEDSAKYGAKVSYRNAVVAPYEDGKRFRVAMDAEIKNAFGAWGKSRFSCIVNGTTVTQLVVDGQKIW